MNSTELTFLRTELSCLVSSRKNIYIVTELVDTTIGSTLRWGNAFKCIELDTTTINFKSHTQTDCLLLLKNLNSENAEAAYSEQIQWLMDRRRTKNQSLNVD